MIRATLRLERPLAVFDLETTGIDPASDRIVEIAVVRIGPDGRRTEWCRRVDPERPIPPEATAVHGITDADVAGAPTFPAIAADLQRTLAGCDLSGFNIERFDLPLLAAEFRRIGSAFPDAGVRVLDSCRLFHRREPRDLAAALRFYCGAELHDAHSGLADARAAAEVLLAQVAHYPDLPRDVAGLDALLRRPEPGAIDSGGKLVWRDGEAVLNFGKHRGRALRVMAEQDPDYLQWILGRDFPEDTKALVADALGGRYPQAASGGPPTLFG